MNKRIIFFTKYTQKGPSSRYRTFQYLPYYQESYTVKLYPFFSDLYLDCLFNNRPIAKAYLLKRLLKRIWDVLFNVSKGDIVFIEYELVPFFPAILERWLKFRGIKFILDYDDAIFHNYDQSSNRLVRKFLKNKIPTILKKASHVITGSPYLTSFVQKYNEAVTEIPTSISKAVYANKHIEKRDNEVFTIGWVGSKTTSKNIISILEPLREANRLFNYKLSLIGFDRSLVPMLEGLPYNLVEWNAATEPFEIGKFDVGVMPLEDTLFNRGKCGFKLVQYMACGIPTISSPLEANVKINRNKKNLHADSHSEWKDAFVQVYQNRDFFKTVGQENYIDFLAFYALETNVSVYLSIFSKL